MEEIRATSQLNSDRAKLFYDSAEPLSLSLNFCRVVISRFSPQSVGECALSFQYSSYTMILSLTKTLFRMWCVSGKTAGLDKVRSTIRRQYCQLNSEDGDWEKILGQDNIGLPLAAFTALRTRKVFSIGDSGRLNHHVQYASYMEAQVEQMLSTVIHPIGLLYRKIKCLRDNSRKVLYVQRRWLCRLFFEIVGYWCKLHRDESSSVSYRSAESSAAGISP